MSPSLMPTGSCFDDALEYLEHLSRSNPQMLVEHQALWLVHGLCRARNAEGTIYAHGWVELDGHCIEAGLLYGNRIYYGVRTDRYYAKRNVIQATAYRMVDVLAENERTNNYGPWQQEYLDHCLNGRPARILGKVEGIFGDET